MKIPLTILALVAVMLAAFYVFAPAPDPGSMEARTDLPWQITVNRDGSSRVFDLDLGSATLADAIAKFGGLEGFALFEPNDGPLALEGYFGNVRIGMLLAKVIVVLEATPGELDSIRARASDRSGSPSGDWKYTLTDIPGDHLHRLVRGIAYIPGTRDLDAAFFRKYLGDPTATLRESEQAVSWFYPELGLSILIDDEAREVLEYLPPRDFVMPEGVAPFGE